MISLYKNIVTNYGEEVYIKYLNDIHVGYINTDYQRLANDIQKIQDNNNFYWVGGGDYLEAINKKDKRHLTSDEAKFLWGKNDILKVQKEYFIDSVLPIKDKCLAFLEGNHEQNMLEYHDRDVASELAKDLDIESKFLGYCGYLVLRFEVSGKTRMSVPIFLHHGYGYSVRPGSLATTLERVFIYNNCQVALLGHHHHRLDIEMTVLNPRGSYVEKQQKVAAYCGGYRESYSLTNKPERGYESEKGFPPNIPGGYILTINPTHRTIKLVKD